MISPTVALALALAVAAPERRERPVRRIDRAHIVGSPVLDRSSRPGLYIWREDGRFQFAVVGARIEFQVRSDQRLRLAGAESLQWRRRSPRHVVGRSAGGRGALESSGTIKVGRARRGERRARIYLGPLARRAAKTVEIGAFGAVKR